MSPRFVEESIFKLLLTAMAVHPHLVINLGDVEILADDAPQRQRYGALAKAVGSHADNIAGR